MISLGEEAVVRRCIVWARAARPPPTTTRPKRLDERDEHEVRARGDLQ
jgi:hypothetical protein